MEQVTKMKSSLLVAALMAVPAFLLPPLPADTVFLKDGTQINDCKVTAETETMVTVDTPVGEMKVPRTQIHRLIKTKTVHDLFAEQRAKIRDDDANGLFRLAQWARTKDGLRQESDELLGRVIELKAGHAEARRLLGHVKAGSEWFVPEPVQVRLKVSGPQAKDLRTYLDLFLKTRNDFRLEPETAAKDSGEPLDRCAMSVTVITTRKAPGTFYGMTLGGPILGATVRLEAQGGWIGKPAPRTAIEGQVPASTGNMGLAVKNAFGTGAGILHRYLDGLTEVRAKKLEEDLRKKEREKRSGASKPIARSGKD